MKHLFEIGNTINKGRNRTEEWKEKTRERMIKNNPFKGKKHNKKTIKIMRLAKLKNPTRYWLGRKRPDISSIMKVVHVGNKNRYIQDRSKLVKRQLRNDSAYVNWRNQVLKRDERTCRINSKDCSGYCIVHHILSWRDYKELRYEINNGITLCQAHHPLKRAEEKLLIPTFQELVSQMN